MVGGSAQERISRQVFDANAVHSRSATARVSFRAQDSLQFPDSSTNIDHQWIAAAESLPNAAAVLEKPSADAVRAELQVLLAEIKRLSIQQERLKAEVNGMHTWKAKDAAANYNPNKNKSAPKLGGFTMAECLGPALTLPVGRQNTASSSDWSEAAVETPIRNVVSGVFYAVDTLYYDLNTRNSEGAVPGCLEWKCCEA